MYGWGGSDPSAWKGPGKYSYDSARSPYLDSLGSAAKKAGPRTYAKPSGPDMSFVNTRGKEISSESNNPIILGIDVTGSMNKWPAEIFDRLPLFYQTLSQYRPDTEICFSAIGDAFSDQYPIQVNDFAKGLELEKKIKALYPEGNGGGQLSESYELFAYFIDKHAKLPNATNPFLIIFGDEKFYKNLDERQVKHYIGDELKNPVESKAVLQSLLKKFNLFYLQKDYGYNESSTTNEIRQYWSDAIGAQRVIPVPSMERAVDVAMGIVAKQWGEYTDFTDNLNARQDSVHAATVHASLRHLPDKSVKHSVLYPSLKKLPAARSLKKLNP